MHKKYQHNRLEGKELQSDPHWNLIYRDYFKELLIKVSLKLDDLFKMKRVCSYFTNSRVTYGRNVKEVEDAS